MTKQYEIFALKDGPNQLHITAANLGLKGLSAICAVADICRDELPFEMDALAVVEG